MSGTGAKASIPFRGRFFQFWFRHGNWELNIVSLNRQDSNVAAGDAAPQWAGDAHGGGDQIQPLV